MEILINSLTQYGALAVISGFVLWHSFKLQERLLTTIKDNTEAMTKLSVLIEKFIDKG